MGTDGRIVPYPPHVDTRIGTDGRIVPDLSQWKSHGSDLPVLAGENIERDLFNFVFINSDQRLLLLALDDSEDLDLYIQYLTSQMD